MLATSTSFPPITSQLTLARPPRSPLCSTVAGTRPGPKTSSGELTLSHSKVVVFRRQSPEHAALSPCPVGDFCPEAHT